MSDANNDERPKADPSSRATNTPVTISVSTAPDEPSAAGERRDGNESKDVPRHAPHEAAPKADTSVASDGNQNTVIGELRGDINNNIHNGYSVEDFKKIFLFAGEIFSPPKPIKETVNHRTVSPFSPPANEEEYAKQFEALIEEDKLFVVILRLFQGISWVDFWVIYDLAAGELLPSKKIKSRSKKETSGEDEGKTPLFSSSHTAHSQSDDYWVKVAHAEIKQVTYEYLEGKTTSTVISFRSPEILQIVTNYLSNYQRRRLMRMLPVLRQLAYNTHTGTYQLLGEAVAIISQIDFTYVKREVINYWLDTDNTQGHTAVGYVLDAIIKQQVVDAEAVVLLNRWCNATTQRAWYLHWAVGASYSLIGLHHFDLVSKGLTSLIRLMNQLFDQWQQAGQASTQTIALLSRTPNYIQSALVILGLTGKPGNVVNLLAEWTAEHSSPDLHSSPSAHKLSDLIIFVTIVRLSFAALQIRKEQSQGEQPDFFDLLGESRDIRKALADVLLYSYKQNADYRKSLVDMLEKWVEYMDELKLDTDPVRRIVIYLFKNSDANNRERLLRALHRWAGQKNTAVRTLGAALEHKLSRANYPLPDTGKSSTEPSGSSGSGAARIVFGKS